jgi:hypothetical protein
MGGAYERYLGSGVRGAEDPRHDGNEPNEPPMLPSRRRSEEGDREHSGPEQGRHRRDIAIDQKGLHKRHPAAVQEHVAGLRTQRRHDRHHDPAHQLQAEGLEEQCRAADHQAP